jgi:hypothetical protein
MSGSNLSLICRPVTGSFAPRCFISVLLADSVIDSGLCDVGSFPDQPVQFPDRKQVNLRGAQGHAGADRCVEHPVRQD